MITVKEILADDTIESAFGNSDFGSRSKRDIIRYSLLKYASGYSTGHTAECICRELGLIKHNKNYSAILIKTGKQYLFAAFYNGVSL